jgi:uncharacterized protein (TIGR02757 family)
MSARGAARARLAIADERRAAIGAALDEVRARCRVEERLARDPVGAVHAYRDPEDAEIVALVAASIAFGNVTTIRAKLADALARLTRTTEHPARTADDARATLAAMRGWVHRVFRGEDVARLAIGARAVQRDFGSLGRAFAADLAADADLRGALAAWCARIRDRGGLTDLARRTARRGPVHLLPDPRGASGSKRLLLFLRWMVRPKDGVDLGLWSALVPARVLLCPVDTHIHKLSRNLGLTRRADLSWKTTVEITGALAAFDPEDPVKYDFALCHMGMLQRCPSRRDARRCEGCGVMRVCRHWTR